MKMINGMTEHALLDNFWPALIFSWLLSLFITGIFAFAGFALPTQQLMPSPYYEIKNSKKLNKYFKLLRADIFKKLLIKFIYGKPKNKKAYFDGKRSGIDHFITNTKKSEFGHLIPFVITLIITIYLLLHQKFWLAAGLLFFNIIGNFYPFLLALPGGGVALK
ncbi:MAG: hypothetical protein AAFZ15_10900 [Bacteroidota bacterium]